MPKPLNLLILEDNPLDAELLLIELRRAGYKINSLTVDNEKDFVAHLNPDLDLILSDYNLPQFNGLEALRLRNESKYDIPFIIVSGEISEELAVECMREGADDYLMKDRLGRLGSAVDNAISKKALRNKEKQAELALQESKQQYQSVVEDSPGYIYRFKPGFIITFVNETYCQYIGKKCEELVGMNLLDLIPKEARESIMSNFTSLSQESPILTHEHKVNKDDGEIRWMRWTNRAIFDEKGKVVSYQSFGEDITDRKQAENELQESEERFRAFMEHLPASAYIKDKSLRYIYSNQAGAEIVGESIDTFIGTRSGDILPKETAKVIEALDKSVIAEGKTKQHEFKVEIADGNSRSTLDTKFPIRLPDGSINIGGIGLDITERVQARHEIEMLLELSRQANAETTLDDLLFFIANKIVEVISPAEAVSVFLFEEERKVVKVQAWAGSYGFDVDGVEFEIADGQVGRIFRTKKPALIRDVSKDPDFQLLDIPGLREIRSQIIVPFIFKERVAGVIYADNLTKTDAFSQEDLDLLESIGNQLSGVIENARMLEQVGESEEQYRNLFGSMLNGFALHEMIYDDTGKPVNYRFIEINPAFENLTGLKGADIIGKTALEVLPELEPIWIENYRKVALTGEPLLFEQFAQELNKHFEVVAFSPKKDQFATIFSDVTERKIFTHELQQERDKAQEYLDIAEVMIVAIDKDGEITLVNQKGASILGYQDDELIGKSWFDTCVPVADRKRMKKMFDDFMAGGVGLGDHFEQTVITRSGEKRIIDWHSTPLWEWDDEEKHRIGSLNSGEDITERKLTDKKLRQSEKQYQSVVEDSPGVISRFTPDGTIIFANQAYCKYFGRKYDELIGMNIQSVIPEEGRESVISYIGSLTQESPIKTFENKVIRHDGKIRWMRWVDRALFDDAGQVISIQSFGQDITRMVEAEQELLLEQEKAKKYLDIAGVVLVALNRKGEITLINQKGSQILGYQEDELIGVNWFDTCLPERNRKEVKQVFRKIMAGDIELVEFYENPILTKSGEERIIAWHNTVISGEKGNNIGVLSSGEDITKRVRTEQLLNALNRAAVTMGAAHTQQEIFNAVARELKQIDISCMLFPLDETRSRLITKFISHESSIIKPLEKLVGLKYENFSFPIDTVDVYRRVIKEKETLLKDTSEHTVRQMFPKLSKKIITLLVKLSQGKRTISTPLIVENEAIGMLLLQSGSLILEDIPTAIAFADQLSSAWNKVGLLQNLRKTVEGTIHTIAATVEARDPYTAGHQTRVANLAAAIAQEMHLTDDQIEGIRMAGIIHDLGKINIPAEILSKPGELSELEFDLIKTHPQSGFDLLKEIEFPWPIAEMVLQHHEKIDGSGYPQGLKGDNILLEARILAVADIVEAMSSHRPYRPAHGIEKALAQIREDRGTLLDPEVVDACLKIFKEGYKLTED